MELMEVIYKNKQTYISITSFKVALQFLLLTLLGVQA
jgi:hypothetical protein